MKSIHIFYSIALGLLIINTSCKQETSHTDIAEVYTEPSRSAKAEISTISATEVIEIEDRDLSQEFKDYWYSGEAEITSYQLEQARYGEIRPGTAALIFVTEDFLPKVQVKADRSNTSNVPVLKLNRTKKFNTGIYPYSVMTSTFHPVHTKDHAIKISQSMQEWCGHQYAQINNRKNFEVISHSYFEGEADATFELEKATLENELWTLLRINPDELPTGNIQVIPNLEFVRMRHVPLKAYPAIGKKTATSYTLEYPDLKRKLTINFSERFPYTIEGWEETSISGFGPNAKSLTTKATRMKSIQSAYWGKNSNADDHLRDALGL